MKRKLIVLLSLLSITIAAGCSEESLLPQVTPPTTDLPELDDLDGPTLDEDLNDFELLEAILEYLGTVVPTQTAQSFRILTEYEGVSIDWSTDADIISITDDVVEVTRKEEDVNVNLFATLKYESRELTEEFDVIINRVLTPLEAIDASVDYLESQRYMHLSTSGSSVSTAVTQQINNDSYFFDGYEYSAFSSSSNLVNFIHRALYNDGNVAYFHDNSNSNTDGTPAKTSRTAYLSTYGLVPDKENFTGYVINEDTITSSEYLGYTSGVYSYKYILDLNSSCESMKTQMKTFGGLSSLPTFSLIEVTLFIDSNEKLLQTNTHEIYDAKKSLGFLGSITTTLEQNLVTSFIEFDPSIYANLPNTTNYFNVLA